MSSMTIDQKFINPPTFLDFLNCKAFKNIKDTSGITKLTKSLFQSMNSFTRLSSKAIDNFYKNTRILGSTLEKNLEFLNFFIVVSLPIAIAKFVEESTNLHKSVKVGNSKDILFSSLNMTYFTDTIIQGSLSFLKIFAKFGAWSLEGAGSIMSAIGASSLGFSLISFGYEIAQLAEKNKVFNLLDIGPEKEIQVKGFKKKLENLEKKIQSDTKFVNKRQAKIIKERKSLEDNKEKLQKQLSELTDPASKKAIRLAFKIKDKETALFLLKKEEDRLIRFLDLAKSTTFDTMHNKINSQNDHAFTSKENLEKFNKFALTSFSGKTDAFLSRQFSASTNKDYTKLKMLVEKHSDNKPFELLNKKEIKELNNATLENIDNPFDKNFILKVKKDINTSLEGSRTLIEKELTKEQSKKACNKEKVQSCKNSIESINKKIDKLKKSEHLGKITRFYKKYKLSKNELTRDKINSIAIKTLKSDLSADEINKLNAKASKLTSDLKGRVKKKISTHHVFLVAKIIGLIAGIAFLISAIPAIIGTGLIVIMLGIYFAKVIYDKVKGRTNIDSVIKKFAPKPETPEAPEAPAANVNVPNTDNSSEANADSNPEEEIQEEPIAV